MLASVAMKPPAKKQGYRNRVLRFAGKLAAGSDESLLQSYGDGDSTAFDKLYLRHKNGLYNFIIRSLAQTSAAEEIAQEVWMVVIDSASRFEPGKAKFRTWLYRIASNKVADFYRRKINHPVDELDTREEQFASHQLTADDAVLFQQLLDALAELPDEQRLTFNLQQEGFSQREIAEMTGVGGETVKSRLRYAKSATRQRMELKA